MTGGGGDKIMKIAVTGASGHLGACLVRRLIAEGHQVVAIAKRAETAASLRDVGAVCVNVDVREFAALEQNLQGCDLVYHLAACVSMTGEQGGKVRAVNVEGTRNVAKAALACGIKRMVHVSSIHAYSQRPFDQPLDENRAYSSAPKLPAYDRSKAAGEQVAKSFIKEGLEVVVVQPCGVIGPFDFGTSVMNKAFARMFRGKLPVIHNMGFDLIDVRDVASVLISASQRGRVGESYLVGGRWQPVLELARIASKVAQVKPPGKLALPFWLIRLAAPIAMRVDQLLKREVVFSPDSVSALNSNKDICYDKAKRELGLQTRPVEESIRDLHQWFSEQHAT